MLDMSWKGMNSPDPVAYELIDMNYVYVHYFWDVV